MHPGKVLPLRFATIAPVLAATCMSNARAEAKADLDQRAAELAHKILLIDTHLDTPYELQKRMQDISGRIEGGHFDYVRARQGGLDALFMAVYVPPEYEERGGAKAFADKTIDKIEGFPRTGHEQFA